MTDLFQEPDDSTPLEPEDCEGLRQSWITSRHDLNAAEQANILKGAAWARGRRRRDPPLLSGGFVRTLHRRMFGEVWRWAGTFRRTERNIGIDAYRITTEVESLLSDVRWWVDHATFPDDEIAARLHHRLTVIHPFPNGNGRHARLMADLLVEQRGGPPFSWGSADLVAIGDVRARYVAALRAADRHDLVPLLEFVRS